MTNASQLQDQFRWTKHNGNVKTGELVTNCYRIRLQTKRSGNGVFFLFVVTVVGMSNESERELNGGDATRWN